MKKTSVFGLLVVSLALILPISIIYFGRIQFGGYDGSILINHAWQFHLNYEPYVDIVTGWPPILLIGAFWAFEWWGVRWLSLVYIAAAFSLVTFILHVILLKKNGFNPFLALVVAFTVQSVTMVVISWWWYNNITAVVGVLFVSASLFLIKRQRHSLFGDLSFVVTVTLLMLSKPNITLALMIPSVIILIVSSQARYRIVVLSLASFALVVSILLLSDIYPGNLLLSYSNYAGRSLSIIRILRFLYLNSYEESIQTFAALIPGLAALLIVFSPSLTNRFKDAHNFYPATRTEIYSIILGVLSMLVGLWGMMTNNEYNMTDGAFIFLGIVIIVEELKDKLPIRQTRVASTLVLLCALLLSLNAYRYALLRYRVMGVGVGAFYEDAPLTRVTDPALFDGMFVAPRMIRTLLEMKQLLQSGDFLGRSDASVFFGPRIDFGYAAYNIKPYPGLPTWWEFFNQDGIGETDIMVSRFKNANFQLCIFLRDDYTYLPNDLLSYLHNNYKMYELEDLTIYVRNGFSIEYDFEK
ncbi:MAG TPA: hypothetical protein PLM89_01190 [Anaerolineales bacterium]|nr:hypothetical protein [Anaerolineales bacterium]